MDRSEFHKIEHEQLVNNHRYGNSLNGVFSIDDKVKFLVIGTFGHDLASMLVNMDLDWGSAVFMGAYVSFPQ